MAATFGQFPANVRFSGALARSILKIIAPAATLQNFSHQFAAHFIAENNIIVKVLLLFTK